jgi:Bacterial archaeo-eukaryotic release factor family 10
MTVEALRVDTLERLARLDAHRHPVLRMYVDLDPARFPTPGTRDAQLGSLLDAARREAGDQEVDRIQAWLEADGAIRRGARGLAIFSSARADILEAVRLTGAVEPLVVVDTVPWLEPLAALASPGDWGVAVLSRRSARLLRGGPGGLSEFAAIEDELHRRHAQGGWSQRRASSAESRSRSRPTCARSPTAYCARICAAHFSSSCSSARMSCAP